MLWGGQPLLNKITKPNVLLFIMMFVVAGLSIGYSAYASKLNITGILAEVRLKQDIRVTNIILSNTENNGESTYQDYNKENISMGIYLPEENSQVTYKVEVTNIGNVETGILSIDNLPSNLDYTLTDYKLKDKICDANNQCKLGIKKEFYITIKYKSGGYTQEEETVSTDTNYESYYTYNLNLGINFKPIYTITYTEIEGSYQTEIIETDTLEVDFGDNAPYDVKVLMGDIEISDYTYSNGVLTIPNVSGNVEVQKLEEPKITLVQHITDLYTPNSTIENNSITYNVDTTNNLMDDRLGGTVSSEGNIRYYGASPNNYVDIGDRDADGNVILWRIIGVFETKYATDELPCNVDSDGDGHYDNCASDKLVKVIRNDSIGNMAWDSNNVNDWSTATLNTYLNTSTYYPSLNTDVTSKIETALWNLGGYSTQSGVYANDWYGHERGTLRYDDSRPTEWVDKIGLMYTSDYAYAADLGQCKITLYDYDNTSCKGTNWLFNSEYQWTITPNSSYSYYVFSVRSEGYVNSIWANSTNRGVRPVLYLKSDATVSGGSGIVNDTVNDPFIIEYEGESSSGDTGSSGDGGNSGSTTQYYSWSDGGNVGGILPSDAKLTVSALNPSYPFYLRLDAEDNIVTAVYACFIRNDTEYCLKGGDDGAAYETNKTVLEDAFADTLDSCSFDDDDVSYCNTDTLGAIVNSDGPVYVYVGEAGCDVYDGKFVCYEE